MEFPLPFSIYLVIFQLIFGLCNVIDMNAVANPSVKLGTQFIAVDINIMAKSNVKLGIVLYSNRKKVQELIQYLN